MIPIRYLQGTILIRCPSHTENVPQPKTSKRDVDEMERLRVFHKLEREKSWFTKSMEDDYEKIWRTSERRFASRNHINKEPFGS